MSLGEQQRAFSLNVGKLIIYAYGEGYELTLGEALRTQAQADLNAQSGAGIANSLHLLKLAIDLNLFQNGVWLTDSQAHKPLADYWKTLDPLNRWGGDFSKPDGNHYSMEYNGVQ